MGNAFERKSLILGLLAEGGSVSVTDLVKRLDCSVATVRRDLSELEQSGRLKRIHGGGILPAHLALEPTFGDKNRFSREQKQAIGLRVLDDIPEGATVYVDSGTTCMEAGIALLKRGKNRLYTNSIPLLVAGCRYPCPLMAIGGEVRRISQALVGGLGVPWMDHLTFDIALLGTSAVTFEADVMTTELQEAAIKSQALSRCGMAFLLADAGKFSAKASVEYAKLKQFSALYTDKGVGTELVKTWSRQHGLRMIRC